MRMTTSIKDHQLDHLFEKMENQTNGRIFRPWDCAMSEKNYEAAKSSLKAHHHLREKEINLSGSIKSSLAPRLPNDLLTEMFSASCTMNQTSLSAMESIYSQLYRDYFVSAKNHLAIKMENGSSISNNDLSFLSSLGNSKLNLSKLMNDCTVSNNLPNGLTSNGARSSDNSLPTTTGNLMTANGLITDNNRITNGLLSNSRSSGNHQAISNNQSTSKRLVQQTTKLSESSANESNLTHQPPVNKAINKTNDSTNFFLTPLLNSDKNQSKKPRPKRFRCPHCDIAFSNNGQLKGHIRTHTGKRRFFLKINFFQ